jgi:hypothetical protein
MAGGTWDPELQSQQLTPFVYMTYLLYHCMWRTSYQANPGERV